MYDCKHDSYSLRLCPLTSLIIVLHGQDVNLSSNPISWKKQGKQETQKKAKQILNKYYNIPVSLGALFM